MSKFVSHSSSETYYKNQLDIITKENKSIKDKSQILEKQNLELQKSLYELGFNYRHLLNLMNKTSHNYSTNFQNDLDLSIFLNLEPKKEMSVESFRDGTNFKFIEEFEGHEGAVYAVRFSKCGKFLASCSFDHTIHILKGFNQKPFVLSKLHSEVISDIKWSYNSDFLLSGGYDHIVNIFDVGKSELAHSFFIEEPGLIQTVEFSSENENIIYVGSSNKSIYLFDARSSNNSKSSIISEIKANSSVNTLASLPTNNHLLLAGTSKGILEIFDLRKKKSCLESIQNSSEPISHISVSQNKMKDISYGEFFIGLNSYDNVIRVYESSKMKVISTCVGHSNKNLPIKGSFCINCFMEKNQNLDKEKKEKVLFATGSSDHKVYIFDIKKETEIQPLQVIEDYSGVVNCVDFHPKVPLLATGSSDFSIKLWGSTQLDFTDFNSFADLR
ncbi:hypothetical protein M0811_03672 [Anaeramoeba ignava]|uniref:Uncharacterized protein n=1 Tax=Anaeramoeba ignava TaxID=1746090 RepID=A0A9Q0RHV4_ANAIG|nr:hypothetical protein M0811_03672 [Anaeramoeba ignava]